MFHGCPPVIMDFLHEIQHFNLQGQRAAVSPEAQVGLGDQSVPGKCCEWDFNCATRPGPLEEHENFMDFFNMDLN